MKYYAALQHEDNHSDDYTIDDFLYDEYVLVLNDSKYTWRQDSVEEQITSMLEWVYSTPQLMRLANFENKYWWHHDCDIDWESLPMWIQELQYEEFDEEIYDNILEYDDTLHEFIDFYTVEEQFDEWYVDISLTEKVDLLRHKYHIQPLYLYEHGGIVLQLYHTMFDSRFVGFLLRKKDNVPTKDINEQLLLLNQYITNDFYNIVVYEYPDNYEEITRKDELSFTYALEYYGVYSYFDDEGVEKQIKELKQATPDLLYLEN